MRTRHAVRVLAAGACIACLLALALPARGQAAPDPEPDRDAPEIEQLAPASYVARLDDVAVRAAPALLYRAVTRLGQGEGVVVNGRKGEWLRLAGGGWVLASQVRTREEAAADPGRDGALPWTVVAASANVRSSRGTAAPVVGRLIEGDSVDVVRVVDGWAEVPGGWIREDLLRSPSLGASSESRPAAESAGRRRWSFMSLSGVAITVYELEDPLLADEVNAQLRRANSFDGRWTILGITVGLAPEARDAIHWSPDVTTFIVTDARGEKYGNVLAKGRIERLPAGLDGALGPHDVAPGRSFSGLLLFRPTLSIDDIVEVSVRIDGGIQRLVPAR